ncbi:MAG: hypothetical protein ABIF87_06620 [Pseudomonadota bacterium]
MTLSGFPDPAAAFIYDYFTRKLYPELNVLLEEGVLSEQKMHELLRDVYDVSLSRAVELVEQYIMGLSGSKRIRVALIPAGGMFREIVERCDFSGVELVGGFDSCLTEPGEISGVPVYPTTQLSKVSPNQIIILSGAYAREIFNSVAGLIDPSKVVIYCPFWDPVSSDDRLAAEIAAINTLCSNNRKAPVILVTCIRFFSFLYKRLKALRQANAKVILVTLLGDVSHTVNVHEMEDACDYIFSADGHMLNYLRVLSNTNPDIVHIFANAGSSSIPVIASSVCNKPYVVEYNDLLTNMHDKKTLAKAIGVKKSRLEFKSEQYLIHHSKGLIYNNHKSAIDHLFDFHSINSPLLEFSYYPLNKVSDRKQTDNECKKIRLVFIGGIHHSQYEDYWNNSITQQMFKMVDILTKQNFTVDIYNAYDSGRTNDFIEFHNKEIQNSNFRYHKAVHPKKLTEVLLEYDAGLFVHDYKNSQIKKDVIDRTMSSRFFEYLEAGLPIVMSCELQFMVNILEKNSLGISIEYDQMQNLSKLLHPQKLSSLQRNVKKYVNKMIMEKHIHKLIEFYNSAMNQQCKHEKSSLQQE